MTFVPLSRPSAYPALESCRSGTGLGGFVFLNTVRRSYTSLVDGTVSVAAGVCPLRALLDPGLSIAAVTMYQVRRLLGHRGLSLRGRILGTVY